MGNNVFMNDSADIMLVDQTDYHLRNSATDLRLPKPKREFLKIKEVLNIAAHSFGTNSQMKQN